MHALTYFVFVVLAHAIQGKAYSSSFIFNGTNATFGKLPYHASLRFNGSHLCSGCIINNVNILTAAQCVVRFQQQRALLNNLKVHVGTNYLNEDGYIHDVADINININFDNYFVINDIALIYLKSPLTYNKLVQPIILATSEVKEGSSCKLSGWGITEVGGNLSNILQEINLSVHPRKECETMNWRMDNTHICTLSKNGGPCRGDLGAPLVSTTSTVPYLIGITSSVDCKLEAPTLYTKIYAFSPWINANLKKFQCT